MSNSTNPYRPDEDEATILLERNFIAGDLIVGMGYGMYKLKLSKNHTERMCCRNPVGDVHVLCHLLVATEKGEESCSIPPRVHYLLAFR